MSLARKHRESFSNIAAPAVLPEASGFTPSPAETAPATLAARTKARVLAQASAKTGEHAALDRGTPEERAAAQMRLRLQTDLRRLKDIASIERKIAAKREMLPEYDAWVAGLVAADVGVAEDVLPTIMVWRIDTGDFAGALVLAEHVLKHNVPLPSRYERSAPALIAEEIATAALKAQSAGEAFPYDILERVAELTEDADMHDEIRAKLVKAIGVELMRATESETAEPLVRALAARAALATLQRAQHLHDRVGVKDRIKKLEKLLAPPNEQPPASAG